MSNTMKVTIFQFVVIASILGMVATGMNFLAEIPNSANPETATFGAILFLVASVIAVRYGKEAFRAEKTI